MENKKSKKLLTPSEASKELGVSIDTLRRWSREGKIRTVRTAHGHRRYDTENFINKNEENDSDITDKEDFTSDNEDQIGVKICYCRVSSHDQKDDLESQKKYLSEKYPNHELVFDIGSGINFKRKRFLYILEKGLSGNLEELVVTYKDRLCRIGYDLVEYLLTEYSRTNIIIDKYKEISPNEEITNDLIEIITVYSSKLYSKRRNTIKNT